MSDAEGNHLYCLRTVSVGMSEESARFHAAAEEVGASSREAWYRMKLLNRDVEWDVERMLPELFDTEEDSSEDSETVKEN